MDFTFQALPFTLHMKFSYRNFLLIVGIVGMFLLLITVAIDPRFLKGDVGGGNPPAPTITSPAHGKFKTHSITITGTIPSGAGIANVYVKKDTASTWQQVNLSGTNWNIPSTITGTHVYYFKATNNASANSSIVTYNVSFDEDGPILQASIPEDGDTDVLRDTEIVATFNEPLDATTVNALNVVNCDGPALNSSFEFNNVTLTVNPANNLSSNAIYCLRIQGVKDLAGNEIEDPVEIEFRTGTETGSNVTVDNDGTVTEVTTDGDGNTVTTTNSVNGDGELTTTVTITTPGGDTTTTTTTTGNDGNTTTTTTDENGTTTTVTDPSGEVISTTETHTDGDGNTVTTTTDENGTTVTTTSPDGTVTVVGPDGTVTITYPDGTVVVTDPDGTVTVTFPDGTTITIDPDGTITITYPDGTEIVFNPDGSVVITLPDDTVIEISPNGDITITPPGGGEVSGGQGTVDPDGEVTLSDGTEITSEPGGEVHVTDPDGVEVVFNPDGSVVFTYPDGTVVTVSPTGQITITDPEGHQSIGHNPQQMPDGSVIMVREDGSIVHINPDGTMKIRYPDGRIALISKDGKVTMIDPDGTMRTFWNTGEESDITSSVTSGDRGDVNLDGAIDPRDALKVLDWVLQNTTGVQAAQADVNQDQLITSFDALEILNYTVCSQGSLGRKPGC